MANAIKKISARAKQIQKAHPGKAWKACIMDASKEYRAGEISGSVKSKLAKRKAVPKKRAHRPAAKRHTDTRSHNVNIRVVSGIASKGRAMQSIQDELKNIQLLEMIIESNKKRFGTFKTKQERTAAKKQIAEARKGIQARKKNITNLKRLV